MNEQKTWLVTGAAGFMGSHVNEQLLGLNQNVIAIDSLAWGSESHLPETSQQFQFYKQDIRDLEGMKKIIKQHQPDHILHLAALHYIPLAQKEPSHTVDINVRGTQILLEACRESSYKSFWLASTGDVYKTTTEPLSESETPAEPHNIYGLSKLQSELLLELESSLYPERCFISGRLFNLIGPNETNPHIIPEIIKQLKKDKTQLSLGNIDPIRDYVPVDEAARASIDMSVKLGRGHTRCNVATGTGQSVRDLITTIEQLFDHKIEVSKDPERVRPVDRPKLVSKVEKLKGLIGWTPTSQVASILEKLLKSEGLLGTADNSSA